MMCLNTLRSEEEEGPHDMYQTEDAQGGMDEPEDDT